MTRAQPRDRWTDPVRMAFPNRSRPQATVLALDRFGRILAQRCGLSSVVAAWVPVRCVRFHTIRSRLQEFDQPVAAPSGRPRDELDVTTGFAPLRAGILPGGKSSPLALAWDATRWGDGLTVWSMGVVDRGQAIPVAWTILHANVPHPGKPEWIALRRLFWGWVPPGDTVIVRTDRALDARWLDRDIPTLGWHPVLRITNLSQFRQRGSKTVIPVTALVPRPGCRWQGCGVAVPQKAERRWECTRWACWEEGCEEPWFLVTDLAPDQAERLGYGMRSGIDGGSQRLQSGGWQWPATRMTEPDRAERRWLVLAVATCDGRAMGGEADEEVFATATVPEPVSPSAPASTGSPPASTGRGKARPRRRGAWDEATAARSRDGDAPGPRSAWSVCSVKAWPSW